MCVCVSVRERVLVSLRMCVRMCVRVRVCMCARACVFGHAAFACVYHLTMSKPSKEGTTSTSPFFSFFIP